MRTTVYLNTSRDASFGFTNDYSPASLLTALRFNYDGSWDGTVEGSAEKIFEQLNVGGDLVPATEWTAQYRADGHRSLSVGDVVKFEIARETYIVLAVGRAGWERITVDQLHKALGANAFPCRRCAEAGKGMLQLATRVADTHVELECGHSHARPARV